jgi:hypothetical protein
VKSSPIQEEMMTMFETISIEIITLLRRRLMPDFEIVSNEVITNLGGDDDRF